MESVPKSATQFLDFVNESPSPFHAVEQASIRLKAAGFVEIKEKASWEGLLKPNGKYFFTRNKSSIIAFAVGGKYAPGSGGFSIVAAHTDSPCLKVKPVSKKEKSGYCEVGVQLYGGGLWHTWFDRDLSIAGRVIVQSSSDPTAYTHHLVKINRPILRVPTLAIHLDRGVNNDGFKFNTEVQLGPVLCSVAKQNLNYPKASGSSKSEENEQSQEKHHPSFLGLLASELKCNHSEITDFELCLYDTQPSAIGGMYNEYIFSPRCDNLVMSFVGISSLVRSLENGSLEKDTQIRVVSLFDNEEVGSQSAYGADSSMMEVTMKRIINSFGNAKATSFEEAIHRSYMISADMAHAIHPNYADKHEENHRPHMNEGVVIKTNANQRYATTAQTTVILRECARRKGAKLQEFVVRNDSPCGSTIGPILSAKLGLRTIDVGNPQLSMHSIRETCGTEDIESSILLFESFFENFAEIDKKITVD
ncbi:aspartyl aminopeptidase-like protein [Paraphysoderma sedebokerense]|nr:aspartyl aminopeptidase-like protein [Paraphysoderma sedebokerense]